ncbi:FAD-dependent oxidoreductase [Devosia sp. XJ19-1]|uniref:FAD-dependent oxidoreductase n=1 Tax=Devosia ureilytica TaxID=2952754 RepID=A0A9Q4AM30_9HYPH|nr:FAD-dependent oxidoreductase [Devosia ureilytica]MCP8883210.1 FAD-dependent oxidoreductase [Devosia ureilytica]MCP8886422.1 FAD-dependent oxidoreductase [Devosia ureilytica]
MSAEVLVIGGGPAGASAALHLARAGLHVTLCEQGPRLGGALHRQPDDPAQRIRVPRAQSQRWRALSTALEASSVQILCRHMFAGIEGGGTVLLEDRASGRLVTRRPAALVLALGAVERVTPLPGWQLPGVTTVGGLQVMMKSTGQAPDGDVLVAGSGPLLLALAAQMAALGKAPVAVLERSPKLVSPSVIASLITAPAYLREASHYLLALARAGALPQHGTWVRAISPRDGRLAVTIVDRHGRDRELVVDRVALHDGLLPNQNGTAAPSNGPFVVRAGDCREVLGGVAAMADGRHAAKAVLAHLGRSTEAEPSATRVLSRERRAQAAINALYDYSGADPAWLPDETVICRCEGRTLGQLRDLLASSDPVSAREIKLNGRFGMGACQGRFCAEWVAAFIAAQRDGEPPAVSEIIGSRWPVKPVPISAFVTLPPSRPSE